MSPWSNSLLPGAVIVKSIVLTLFLHWTWDMDSLAPAYERAASSLAGIAKFVAVNCDDEENKPLCATYGVTGIPIRMSILYIYPVLCCA